MEVQYKKYVEMYAPPHLVKVTPELQKYEPHSTELEYWREVTRTKTKVVASGLARLCVSIGFGKQKVRIGTLRIFLFNWWSAEI